jgi:ClpP class serine protease
MNFSLAREIYGLNGWCVDSQSLPSLMSILKNIQSGVALEVPEIKYNSISCYDIQSKETRLITETRQLRNDNDFDGIGIINFNGVITKGGGSSSYGTKDLATQMLTMSNDNRIKGFILKVDSGGGASNAVSIMSDAINQVKKTKPVYTLVEKGGYMASAAYGIGSAGNKLFAEDGMSIIGSVGTMIAFEGKKANTTDKNGVKNIVLYATKSTEKNKAFNEALDNDNYELLINELLDPVNESFINLIANNRPQLKGTDFDNGHTEFAKNSIGKFIDGIASFDEVVEMVLSESKNYSSKSNLNINQNSKSSKKMNRQELQQNHPELVNTIREEGVLAERERVSSWLVYQSADPEAVATGIESGAEISASQREKFLVKMNSKNVLDNLKADSTKAVKTAESTVEKVEEVVDNKELESAFDFKL